jgi:hypothetical protein
MKLPRPYIPLQTRIVVAGRQYSDQRLPWNEIHIAWPKKIVLEYMLNRLFGGQPYHLDHEPSLAVRKKIRDKNGVVIRYSPDANDPDFLVYRRAEDHKLKTNVRGDGAQYPDRVRIKKIRRIERPKPKQKYNWPKRRFGKCDSAKHK